MKRLLVLLAALAGASPAGAQENPAVARSAKSGPWSDAATWQGGKSPAAGNKVLIQTGHTVVLDLNTDTAFRSVHVSGTLTFAPDKNTRLNTGLVRIQAGDTTDESGFDCAAHVPASKPGVARPGLLVGTPEQPIAADVTAKIRLVWFDGLDKQSCPAVVCCGGRMDFHGAPMNRTWVRLGAPVKAGDSTVTLAEPVTGWRPGDRVILVATTRQNKSKKTFTEPSLRGHGQTEERIVKAVEGARLVLDAPAAFDHACVGDYRGEVANLSRNVVVESADPAVARGHTMYHRGSAGSISYAEFRHLGMPGVLGRYSLHYHLVGDTMRGSSVIGASIWDSGNRWLTIHGTNHLVVRDCVGYQSRGHGFFLEDGTEVFNVLDRNLAVQAFTTNPLPQQINPFDKNDGSGFWWANCRNTFTRNVAAECDEYGYFFQAAKTKDFDPVLSVKQPDGTRKRVDIRTLPFVRFEDNEAHTQRRHAFNLGGGVPFGEPNVGGVGPDRRHPFVIRNFRAWDVHWALHPVAPSLLVDGLDVFDAHYGVWRPVYKDHAYRGVRMTDVPPELHYAFAPPNAPEAYPGSLAPTDDLPPSSVITHVRHLPGGKVHVRGTTSDDGRVGEVTVNGQGVKQLAPNYAEWEATLPAPPDGKLTAAAKDAAGNAEQTPHVRMVSEPVAGGEADPVPAASAARPGVAGAGVEVVTVVEGDKGPGFKPAANVMGAVGPKHVVEFTIAGFAVRDRATGKTVRHQTQLEFWRQVLPAKSIDPSPHANDPWMVYDPLSERWFATVGGTGTGESFLAVSSSSDPTQPWRGVSLPVPRIDPGMKIGVDRNGVYLSCANGSANPREALDVYVIPKADAIDPRGPSLARARTVAKVIYAAFPAVNVGPGQPPETPAVLINNEFGGPKCGELYLHRITWSGFRASISDAQTIPLSRAYAVPRMEGKQPDGGVRLVQSGGRRNNCAFVHGGSVFSCNGAQRTADSRPGILWYEVRIADGKLLQEGFIDSPDHDLLYPSLAVDSRGTVGIGCTRTSEKEYPSVCVMMRAKDDPAGTMRPPVVAVKGSTAYRHAGVTAMNFSNYSTTCIDPADRDVLWTFQGYANSAVDRQWCTAWAAFRLDAKK